MNRKLIYGGVVLAGLCLRGGWEACLKFAQNPPEQIYFVMGDRDCGLDSSVRDKYPNRMIFNDVNVSILTLEAKGISNGRRYFGKYYPLESRAEIGVVESNGQ